MGTENSKEDNNKEVIIEEEEVKNTQEFNLFGSKKRLKMQANLEKLQNHIINLNKEDPEYKVDQLLFNLKTIVKLKEVMFIIEQKGIEKNSKMEEEFDNIINNIIVDDKEKVNEYLSNFSSKFS
jgi:hypothetical protein